MSKPPTLTVVGGKAPEPDAEAAEAVARATLMMAEAVKAGGGFFLLTVTPDDGDATYYGDALELGATAEEVGRSMKRAALGLE